MKAVVYKGPGIAEYEEVKEEELKSQEVKIQIDACGICGSDVQGYMGRTGRRIPPMIMGHEFCGTIVETGSAVNTKWLRKRVAIYPVDFCGHCEMCKKGLVHLCLNKRAFGVLDVNGAFAEKINVPIKCCFPINDNIPDEIGALMEPLAVAYRGVCHAGDIKGKTVVIIGAGTIGLLALACCKLKEAGRIIVSDLSDSRLKTAAQMGADTVINPKQVNFEDVVFEETNGKMADIAIEAVGTDATVGQALSSLKLGGTAVWIGNNKPQISVHMQMIVTRELKIYGSFLYGYQEFKEMVLALNEGRFQVEPLISKIIGLDEVPQYLDILAHTPGDLIKVIVSGRRKSAL